MIKDHYERLSCGHQNNLLLKYPDGHMNIAGVCPKGCKGTNVLKTAQIESV